LSFYVIEKVSVDKLFFSVFLLNSCDKLLGINNHQRFINVTAKLFLFKLNQNTDGDKFIEIVKRAKYR